MSVTRVFTRLRAALDAGGIPYFVTGSFASSAHGIPRPTNDIDIVIAEDALDALAHNSLFNIIDYATDVEGRLHHPAAHSLR